MTDALRNFLIRSKTFFTPPSTPTNEPKPEKCTKDNLFPLVTEKELEECPKECASCPYDYPQSFYKIGIEKDDKIYGRVKRYTNHLVVATGKSDWIRDVEEEKGSVMEALAEEAKGIKDGRIMISASNMPPPHEYYEAEEKKKSKPTTVLVLPAFEIVEMVEPADVPELVRRWVRDGPTTEAPLGKERKKVEEADEDKDTTRELEVHQDGETRDTETKVDGKNKVSEPTSTAAVLAEATKSLSLSDSNTIIPPASSSIPAPLTNTLKSYPSPHDYLILICSHTRRDKRCGLSAPILQSEFARILRPLGLYRDHNDTRPGGVGIYFINHVGGHKYAANLLIYRKKAGEGIWLGRVTPKDCESIVKWTVLEGKVVDKDMLRGGFTRDGGKVSW